MSDTTREFATESSDQFSNETNLFDEDLNRMKIAVLLPCYNEEPCIAKVVTEFKDAIPEAEIYVYDNNSKDKTSQVAKNAGAIVRFEIYRGKGNVVRRMFADVDADIYVMADGDGTYDASAVRRLIEKLVHDNLDMVIGSRIETDNKAYRFGHKFGNRFLTGMVKYLFGFGFTDILSGYRVMSRRFVKSFPVISSGFEIETEMSVHALQLRLPVAEVETHYGVRPKEAPSKLNKYRDGMRILLTIFNLLVTERPRLLFGTLSAVIAFLALVLATPLFVTWFQTGMVPRFPTAILCVGMILLSAFFMGFGWLLHMITRGRIENKRLVYLNQKAVSAKVQ